MKKMIALVLTLFSMLQAKDKLSQVTITEEIDQMIVKDVSQNEIKSADVAEALSRHIPSINLIRRSGIANDILLRGQKRDNINIIIDGTKICGACVNRMDPPTSHILTNNIKDIKVSEGPFDVENFGTLSGVVNISTKEPSTKLKGDIDLNIGSFGYTKYGISISGGNEKIKALLSASNERSNQYKDGNGDDFAEQIEKNIQAGVVPAKFQYRDRYKDLDAYEKFTLMGKLYFTPQENQELKLSYTANRSDDILYPSSKMDAIYDDSDVYSLDYEIRGLSSYSKSLKFELYQSKVDHPMSTKYRKAGAKSYTTHHLKTEMMGAKLKNSFDFAGVAFTVGIDGSKRVWDGWFERDGNKLYKMGKLVKSLADVSTKNSAIFIKAAQPFGTSLIEYGIRADHTTIDNDNPKDEGREFNSISGNIFVTSKVDSTLTTFWGVGSSSRVPDARELYLVMMGNHFGTPSLRQSRNYELDIGAQKIFGNFSVKAKAYYSYVKDYIAFNAHNKKLNPMTGKVEPFHSFENVDVDIYGAEISGLVLSDGAFSFDYALSYKRGKKRDPLTGQKGTNLADMRPFKALVGLNYEDIDFNGRVEFIGSTRWSDIDYENGEQELSGYGVVNLKATKNFTKEIELSVGVDNLFDKKYAVTNTYKDLILLTNGTDTMLLNEPGRYIYANLKYKF